MSRKIYPIILVVVLSIGFSVLPVMASPPLDVHIEVEEYFLDETPDYFIASGPAVPSILCATGTVIDLGGRTSGPPGGAFSILHIVKQFDCEDGSGTFDVKLVVRLDLINGGTTANWKIIGGTGDYVRLHGNGKLIGIPDDDPDMIIFDIYDGKLH